MNVDLKSSTFVTRAREIIEGILPDPRDNSSSIAQEEKGGDVEMEGTEMSETETGESRSTSPMPTNGVSVVAQKQKRRRKSRAGR